MFDILIRYIILISLAIVVISTLHYTICYYLDYFAKRLAEELKQPTLVSTPPNNLPEAIFHLPDRDQPPYIQDIEQWIMGGGKR